MEYPENIQKMIASGDIESTPAGYWVSRKYENPRFVELCAVAGAANRLAAEARKGWEEKERQAAAEQKVQWASLPHVFIRFGRPPVGGKSTNHARSQTEDGVSCYEAAILPDGGYWVWEADIKTVFIGSFLGDRPAFILEGDVVGRGGDDEPLLLVKKYARIKKGTKIILPVIGEIEAK